MPLEFISDCYLWGNHALGFHITNVILHTLCTFSLYLVGIRLLKDTFSTHSKEVAAFAAAVFAVHPLHAESVSWICGRVDLICTALLYGSFYLFLRAHQNRSQGCPRASLGCYTAAQLFKEAAASLPLTLVIYQVLHGEDDLTWRQRLTAGFHRTKWYWTILIVYLVFRSFALGTWFGGYTGTFGEVQKQYLFYWWFQSGSLWRLLFPYPGELDGPWDWIGLCLAILYLLTVIMAAIGVVRSQARSSLMRTAAFLISWSILALVPVVSAWYMTACLIGGRLIYVASGPLCLLLSVAAFSAPGQFHSASPAKEGSAKNISLYFARALMIGFVICFALLTFFINDFWTEGARDCLKIKTQLEEVALALPSKEKILLLNPPRSAHGVYMFPHYWDLSCALMPPFCQPDLSNKVVSLEHFMFGSALINISHVRRLLAGSNLYVPYFWDARQRQLMKCSLSSETVTRAPLPEAGTIIKNAPNYASKEASGSIGTSGSIESSGSMGSLGSSIESYAVSVSPPLPALAVDYVDVTFASQKLSAADSQSETPTLCLSWGKDDSDGSDAKDLALTPPTNLLKLPVYDDGKPHIYRFQVSQCKSWITTQSINKLKVSFSGDSADQKKNDLVSVTLGSLEHALPVLSPDETALEQRPDGSYGLKGRTSSVRLIYDASLLPGVTSVTMEVSRPDCWFEVPNHDLRDTECSASPLKRKTLAGATGAFEVAATDFPMSAYYEVRIAGLDKQGGIVGYFSDPVSIYIPPP
jgi:hypothetical protein